MDEEIKYDEKNPELYTKLLEAQGHKCAICGVLDTQAPHERLYIDHEHITGIVRGLLCSTCNSMLGFAHDDPKTLVQGAIYLRNWLFEYIKRRLPDSNF